MKGVEVQSGTPATLTCKMTGLRPNEPLKVTWFNEDGSSPVGDPGVKMVPPDGSIGKWYSDNVSV